MKRDFSVSVIIPVYNAEPFLRQSVESALGIACVAEVLLIEDHSPDNCLAICKELAGIYERVKLFQHPNRENRGAGASRNLGIQNAQSEYIAFLDADDYFLPNRFEETKALFFESEDIDFTFGTAQYEEEYLKGSKNYKGMPIPRNNKKSLLRLHLSRKYDAFCTDVVTVKKKSLMQLDHHFNTKLALHQDTELWIRMLYFLKGASETYGNTIAVVHRHPLNRITQKNEASQLLLWETINREFQSERLSPWERAYIFLYLNRLRNHSRIAFIDKFIKRFISKIYRTMQSFEKEAPAF